MKKVSFFLTCLLVAVSFVVNAQTKFAVSPCFHDELMTAQNRLTPNFKAAVDRTYEDLLKNRPLQTRDFPIYVVPVVFHVVYKTDEENISDARIKDQIAVLNANYRRKNADTSSTRGIFKSVAADAGIEFRLDRVVRVKTTALFKPDLLSQENQIPNQVKKADQGGSTAIDPDHFLNIWACKIEPLTLFSIQAGMILGFAYPPAGLSHWPDGAAAPTKDLEGVVVDYRAVGKTGLKFPYPGRDTLNLQGRTMVHEVGHYLGLRHIWGDGSLLGSSCEGEDGIGDTPKASSQSKFDCDQTKNSCVDAGATDLPDMVENFMDYSEEGCQNMFTKGQVDMMRSVLEGPRKKLLEKISAATDIPTTFAAAISPNPSNGNVFFDWKENQPYELKISDMYGRIIERTANNTTSRNVDLSQNSAGIYLFEIRSANRFQVVKVVLSK
jgi:Pregnancy-associated plasma protein-A/Secretion system C-terminal sorting domain